MSSVTKLYVYKLDRKELASRFANALQDIEAVFLVAENLVTYCVGIPAVVKRKFAESRLSPASRRPS